MSKTTTNDLWSLQLAALDHISKSLYGQYSIAAIMGILSRHLRVMGLTDYAFFLREDIKWNIIEANGIGHNLDAQTAIKFLLPLKAIEPVDADKIPDFAGFKYLLPIELKGQPIAFFIMGESQLENEVDFERHFQFITTLTAMVARHIQIFNVKLADTDVDILKQDLEMAKEIQQRLVRTDFDIDSRIEIDGIYIPFEKVGGDYYDFLWQDDKLIFAIGDISGKGISASLLMACCQAHLRTLFARDLPLSQIVDMLNWRISQVSKAEKFVTSFIGSYNTRTRVLEYVNSGHNPPILINGDKTMELKGGSPLLGMIDDINIETQFVDIERDAFLVNYTDGITEMRNEAGEMMESVGLTDFIEDNANLTPKDFNKKLIDHYTNYRGYADLTDDISVLTCRFR